MFPPSRPGIGASNCAAREPQRHVATSSEMKRSEIVVHYLCMAEWLHFSGARLRPAQSSCRRKLFLSIVFLVSVQAAKRQSLRQALEPKLARLSAKSHSAVLLWDLPRSETLAAVRAEVFAAPRCLGSLVKPFLLLAYLNEHCSDLTSHPPGSPLSKEGRSRRSSNVPRRQPRVATLCRSSYPAVSGGVLVQAWAWKAGNEPGTGCFLQSVFLPTLETDISRGIP